MLPLLGLGLLLVLTAYFSTVTYALRGYSRAQLAGRLPETDHRRWMEWLERHENEILLTAGFTRLALCGGVLLGLVAWWASPGVSTTTAVLWPCLIGLGLIALFAVAVPHALAAGAGDRFLARNLGVLAAFRMVGWPIAQPLLAVEALIRRMLRRSEEEDSETQSERIEQEILEVVEAGELQGAVDEEQKEMIRSVFELHETAVSEIMTPRTEVVALDVSAKLEDARRVMLESGHSRIPVYEESLDKIIGVLYIKDLFALPPERPFVIRNLLRKVPVVPETKPIDELLQELRRQKIHMAIVLDEYSGTAGVVTIEDILEELVGEIADEYDKKPTPAIRRIDEDTLEVDGRVHVHEINSELEVELPEDEDYDTIGGFVFTTLGKIPQPGEEFTHANLHFRVVEAEARKINRLLISVVRQKQPA